MTAPACLPATSPGRALADDATAGLVPVGLAELNGAAELMTRVDTKYLVPLDRFDELVAGVRERVPGLGVLSIDGERVFDYESVYFDTEDFALFRHHVQGRRRRYKARTRTYLSSGLCMFEVKLKGARGETVKQRVRHPFDARDRLGEDAARFLEDLLAQEYGVAPLPLAPQLTTLYRRATLVDLDAGERITCDVDLTCADRTRSVRADGHVVVESKSASGRGQADVVLRAMGLRPVKVSKYCMAVALLNPQLPANPWQRVLTQQYGWQRAA